ncbi:hypothetical protein EWB00_006067 [Schistosoma japonicum]|nr:hypothetical protein EWB00_006067 [Schistosoma japonicum]TNN19897.1 hypothetical protein EWB00_006067 [Schistosoma japonicum]TNN19899.1 hypothetical protein EWB00_006067 [Schistosoma japonicum]
MKRKIFSNHNFPNEGAKYRKISVFESWGTSAYPADDLMKARNEFIQRWNVSMAKHAVAKSINYDHYKYPPDVTVKNCLEYPFRYDISERLSFLRTVKNINTTKSAKSNTTEQLLQHEESGIKAENISDEDFSRVCMLLTDKAYLFESTGLANPYQSTLTCCYFCDYCGFVCTAENDARIHLMQTNHLTCSKYTPYYNADICNYESSELQKPRVIANNSNRIYGWCVGDKVICCPTCNLPFLDKIMCAYHHSLQHSKNQFLFTYGEVLTVRELKIQQPLCCTECRSHFHTFGKLVNHWTSSTHCNSPFMPTSHKHCLDFRSIVSVQCCLCERNFTTVLPLEPAANRPSRERKHQSPIPNVYKSSIWVDFGHFCIRHAFGHINQNRISSCILNIRIISFSKSTNHLPPFTNVNDLNRLHFHLNECKRLISYLEKCEWKNHLLVNAQKNFIDLFYEALLHVS